jgi:hypothetical protein
MRCRKPTTDPAPSEEVIQLRGRVATLEAALRAAQESARKAWILAAWGGTKREAQGLPDRDESLSG